jgi:carboxymethylenebutenolidase
MYTTDQFEGMIANTITLKGHNGDTINTYFARPEGPGPFPAVVLIHHLPGWDELYREFTRKFAHNGYLAISPDLYSREGKGTPEDVAAAVRSDGGVSDEQAIADIVAAGEYVLSLPSSNGKTAVFGTCSGGRQAFLAGCKSDIFDGVIECWGGNVIMEPEQLTEKQPISPNQFTRDLKAPILGLYGDLDKSPTPEQVNQHESELEQFKKSYEFHRYPEAGHGFLYYDRAIYHQKSAIDAWGKIFKFLEKNVR